MRLSLIASIVGLGLVSAACGDSGDDGGGGSGGDAPGGQAEGGSGGSDGTCHDGSDCADNGGEYCEVSKLPPLCGGTEDVVFTADCETDDDCLDGPSDICTDTLCAYPRGGGQPELHCRPGCDVAEDCFAGQDCDAEHHCVPAACTTPDDCGDNFDCTDSTCAAKGCTTDADCGDFCVNGACSDVIGSCLLAVP